MEPRPAPSSSPFHVLAIDHGTSGIKAALVSARGDVAASEFYRAPESELPRLYRRYCEALIEPP